MENRRTLTPFKIGIYLIIFFTIWSVRELAIRPMLSDSLDRLIFQIVESVIKLLIWTLPVIVLIKYYQNDMWISLKDMWTNKPRWFKDAPILLIVFVPLLRSFIFNGGVVIDPDFHPTSLIGSVLFVGVTEEIVFRGFLLNALLKKMKTYPAIALNEVLFVLIHFPFWIYLGFDFSTFLAGSFTVFLLGVLFSFSFIKTKNILVPIVLHMTWNFLTVTLV